MAFDSSFGRCNFLSSATPLFSNDSTLFGSPTPFTYSGFKLYSATKEAEGDGKFISISAMEFFKHKSHEELRFEEYESNKGFKFPIQNQGNNINAFQKSNSSFGPFSWPTSFGASSASSNTSTFGIPTSSAFGQLDGGNVLSRSDSSANPLFSNASTLFGSPNPFRSTFSALYSATEEAEGDGKFISISAMEFFKNKSHEELRFEEYESNKGFKFPIQNKGNNINAFPKSNSSFGPCSWATSFGTTSASSNTSIFGIPTSSAFGQLDGGNALSRSDATPFFSNASTLFGSPTPFGSTYSGSKFPIQNQGNNINAFPKFNSSFGPSFCTTSASSYTSTFGVPASSGANIFDKSCLNSPFQPFQSSLFSPEKGNFTIPSITISTAPTLSPPAVLCPSKSPASVPQPNAAFSFPPISTFSCCKPSVTLTPTPTSVTALGSWPFSSIAEKVDSACTSNQSQPSQVKENDNQQQDVPAITSSLVGNPFAMEFPNVKSNAAASIQHGISSLPVSNYPSSNIRTSLSSIQRVSSRHPSLSAQRPSYEMKVPVFIDEVDRPAPFLPRENPSAWVQNPTPHLNSNDHAFMMKVHLHEADVLAAMPKLPEGDYYTKPSLKELAAAEMAEPGWCSRVKDFTVGRRGYGSIKFLGETDIRHLDLESIVQFNNREVIVYLDDQKKPAVGQGLNKAAEVTILNVKCISKKRGEQYVAGPQVDRYKEILVKMTLEQGGEFVSYDPVEGEWKFRVQHF